MKRRIGMMVAVGMITCGGMSADTAAAPVAAGTVNSAEPAAKSVTAAPAPASTPAAGRETKKLFGPGVTNPSRPDAADRRKVVLNRSGDEGVGGIGIAAWRLWTLLAVLAMMLGGVLYILRKYGRGLMPGGSVELIKVKAKIQLDARNSVSVLKIYEEEFVVGAGAEGVRLLARLMPIDGVEAEPAAEDEQAQGRANLDRAAAIVEKDFASRFKTMIESEEIK